MRTFLFFITVLLLTFTGRSQLSDKDTQFLREELAERINALRTSKGLKALIINDTLQKAATFHSEYMVKNGELTHEERPSKYKTPEKRVHAFGGKSFEFIGENVAFSTPQDFPLNRKGLEQLADALFIGWKNSPPHYANMTHPEYVLGDLGFAVQSKEKIVFATQVFAVRGITINGQLSKNDFGLNKASRECDDAYDGFTNLVLNLGNALGYEGQDVLLYHNDVSVFSRIFSGPNDGIAIDLIHYDQLACGRPNELDLSPIFDGILLKPVYSKEILANNQAEGDYRLISKVGEIPLQLNPEEYSPAIVLIKNGRACKYLYEVTIEHDDYPLRPFEPVLEDEPKIQLSREGVSNVEVIHYNFETDITTPVSLPLISPHKQQVHSVTIRSYSSVEGSSAGNEFLHNSRAAFIRQHLSKTLHISSDLFQTDARENWELMDFQLRYYDRDSLAMLSHDSLKALIASGDTTLPWKSLLYDQREATAIVHYKGSYSETALPAYNLAEFNLLTAIANDDPLHAKKALYQMYQNTQEHTEEINIDLLFKPFVLTFMHKHPETVANFSALLSLFCNENSYEVTRYINNWIRKSNELSPAARTNLLHLYSYNTLELINVWDASSERLARVLHPIHIQPLIPGAIDNDLLLNLHLSFINYFSQINDGKNISRSFDFITGYFKSRTITPEDDLALALFFNHWSMYSMTVDYLFSKSKDKALNEDALFLLVTTMSLTNLDEYNPQYIELNEKAIRTNRNRWCQWMDSDFQLKRNRDLKRMYCETCN